MSRFDVPPLEGWTTISEAAELLGVTRQAVHKMIFDRKLKSVRRLGSVLKPIYVVRTAEVLKAVKPPR